MRTLGGRDFRWKLDQLLKGKCIWRSNGGEYDGADKKEGRCLQSCLRSQFWETGMVGETTLGGMCIVSAGTLMSGRVRQGTI
jgi:hypothetical protein